MSDQWRTERLPAGAGFAGVARRERPLLEKDGVGPWGAKVMITPVLDVGGKPVQYEVHASWLGPGLAIPAALHEDTRPTQASDVVYTPDLALARAIADRVIACLRTPERPDLPGFHRDLLATK